MISDVDAILGEAKRDILGRSVGGPDNGRGGTSPEVDIDAKNGHELRFDQELPADFYKMDDLVRDISESGRLELLPLASGANTIKEIMKQFRDDGEPFHPQTDTDLKKWLKEVLIREHPGLTDTNTDFIVDELEGFPPEVSEEVAAVASSPRVYGPRPRDVIPMV